MKITIDKNRCEERIQPKIWNNIHFHPTDAIEDEWGKKIVDCCARDGVAQYMRIYAMLEDIVTCDDNGILQYDFTVSDARIDYLVAKGIKLLICMNFMPPAIAKDPTQFANRVRYKEKKINISPPKRYELWQEVISFYVGHLIERYGADEVKTWYFHCWNEPDWSFWLNSDSSYQEEKLKEYLKLYDYFAQGIMDVNTSLKFGGPSIAHHVAFFEGFAKHCRQGTNHVTGKIGTRIDFFSLHIYGGDPNQYQNGSHPSIDHMLKQTQCYFDIMKKYQFENTEIIIDEWGSSAAGYAGTDRIPLAKHRDNSYDAAFLLKMMDQYDYFIKSSGMQITKMMICLSGQHHLVNEFDGYRNLFSKNHVPKPIYHAYALLAKLGEEKLHYMVNDPNEDVGIIPTMDDKGNIQVALFNLHENFHERVEAVKIDFTLSGIDGKYKVTRYCIDFGTCDAHTKWVEMGKPNIVEANQRSILEQAAMLKPMSQSVVEILAEPYEEHIELKNESVMVLMFKKDFS